MALTDEKPVCCVCGELANTIRNGRDYCGRHHEGHTPGPPVANCALDGCGSPAVANVNGQDLCRSHAVWAERGTAA